MGKRPYGGPGKDLLVCDRDIYMADASQTKGKGQRSAGFKKPVQPDEKLAAVIGHDPLPRTDLTRKLWEYIRSHNLQDAENKTFIKADDKLKEVFDGKDRVSMFEMTKLVSGHVK
jgi:upstream activation factor subunit UAF30